MILLINGYIKTSLTLGGAHRNKKFQRIFDQQMKCRNNGSKKNKREKGIFKLLADKSPKKEAGLSIQ